MDSEGSSVIRLKIILKLSLHDNNKTLQEIPHNQTKTISKYNWKNKSSSHHERQVGSCKKCLIEVAYVKDGNTRYV